MRSVTLLALVAACGAQDTQMCTDECHQLGTRGDRGRGIAVVFDSACAQGGFGCNVEGHEMCRYCSFTGKGQSAKCPSCVNWVPTPVPVPEPSTTPPPRTQFCTAECSNMVTQEDLDRDVGVVHDTTCAQGGFGCNVQGHKMCRYCSFVGRRLGHHKSQQCPPCAFPSPVPHPLPPGPPVSTLPPGPPVSTLPPGPPVSTLPPGPPVSTLPPGPPPSTSPPGPPPSTSPPAPKPDNAPTCDNFCNSLNNHDDMFSYDQLVIYDPSCINGGVGCHAKGAMNCRYCTWRSRPGSHPTFHCPSCACKDQGLDGCDGAPTPANSTDAVVDPMVAVTGTVTFTNMASNTVSLMRGCMVLQTVPPCVKPCFVRAAAKKASRTMTISGNNKFWIAPQGFKYNCNLDCLDCFYISAIVAGSGAVVTGIGYGQNTPVKAHDGVSSLVLRAIREDTKKIDSAACNTGDCAFEHVIPGFHTAVVIHGDVAPPPAPTPLMPTLSPPAPAPVQPVPAIGMQCNRFCSALNNDDDKFGYDQLIVYDPTCVKGGTGCNAKGASQTCRYCTWRSRAGSHGTPHCPSCACAEQGVNGCVSSPMMVSNSTAILI